MYIIISYLQNPVLQFYYLHMCIILETKPKSVPFDFLRPQENEIDINVSIDRENSYRFQHKIHC